MAVKNLKTEEGRRFWEEADKFAGVKLPFNWKRPKPYGERTTSPSSVPVEPSSGSCGSEQTQKT